MYNIEKMINKIIESYVFNCMDQCRIFTTSLHNVLLKLINNLNEDIIVLQEYCDKRFDVMKQNQDMLEEANALLTEAVERLNTQNTESVTVNTSLVDKQQEMAQFIENATQMMSNGGVELLEG